MHIKKVIFSTLLWALIPAAVSVNVVYSQCPRGDTLCARQRGDSRCNDSDECCSGRQCNSFGYCELRTQPKG